MNDAPPPSEALLRAIADTKPVKTRVPARDLTIVLTLALGWAGAFLFVFPLRHDLPHLDIAWTVVTAHLWMAGVLGPFALAILPRHGQVLPDARRASRVAAAAALVLIGICVVFPVMSESHSRIPQAGEHLRLLLHCLTISAAVGAVPLAIALLALKRVAPIGGFRLAAAAGAASGALAGLVLELICPIGGSLHVGGAHGGGVVVLALLGALVARALF
jgi:hypothetical protein